MKLPPRGSAQDDLITLVYRRKREEKYALITMFTYLVGRGLKVPDGTIERMLELYGLELYQDRYRPSHVAKLRKNRSERIRKKLEDEKLLDRVARLSVPDEDLPPVKKKRSRRR